MQYISKYNFPATWLLQYNALRDEKFQKILSKRPENHELGIWFELDKNLAEEAGIKWCGCFDWDWHANVGFSIGYTQRERKILVDTFMKKFKQVYGFYPSSVGSWLIDAYIIKYFYDKYGIVSSCICKDQWCTDGYTLWGGYYSQAYYPSKKNAFMPAQNMENQIPVPVFRMLGADPIYQYGCPCGKNGQSVITLEPVCVDGGGSSGWVDWYFETILNSQSPSFGYIQIGQENSFGWQRMRKGFIYQMSLLSSLQRLNLVRIQTLSEVGKWYKKTFRVTPASSIFAYSDWKNEGNRSFWYYSSRYRINIYWSKGRMRIRDVHIFDEGYQERYLSRVNITETATYDTLPVFDEYLMDRGRQKVKFEPVFVSDGLLEIKGKDPAIKKIREEVIELIWPLNDDTYFYVICSRNNIKFLCKDHLWAIRIRWGEYKPSIFHDGSSLFLSSIMRTTNIT